MASLDAWARERILESSPGGAGVTAALQQLFDAVLFFEGRRATIFGMTSAASAFPEAAALSELAKDGLRAWFRTYQSAKDEAGCRAIVEGAKRFGVELALPIPPAMDAAFRLRESIARQLGAMPSPLEALAACDAELASYARSFVRDDTDASWIVEHADLLVPETMRGSLVDFDWAEDEWTELPNRFFDPCFFPLGGADGDLVGLYVRRGEASGSFRAPVVYYFHEEDPPFSWMAESLSHFEDMIRAAIGNKGKYRQPKVIAARGSLRPDDEAAIAGTYVEERAETEERKLVHRLLWSADDGARLGAAEALERIYAAEATANPYALQSLRAQAILRSRG
jgi:hypothetical protein